MLSFQLTLYSGKSILPLSYSERRISKPSLHLEHIPVCGLITWQSLIQAISCWQKPLTSNHPFSHIVGVQVGTVLTIANVAVLTKHLFLSASQAPALQVKVSCYKSMQFSSFVGVIQSFYQSHGRHLSQVYLSVFKVWHLDDIGV